MIVLANLKQAIVGRARLSCRLPATSVVTRPQRREPQTTGIRALQFFLPLS
jgi:hypothetical protein